MPSFLDDPQHFELEDAHPDYWAPAPRDPRPWQEIEAECAEFRRRSAQILAQLHEEGVREDKTRAKHDTESTGDK